MPSITADGHSFSVDGRRVWLVSATVHAMRCPCGDWEARLHDVVEAGFNTVELPVVWSRHERVKGKFDFSGDNDVAGFVKLAGERGLMVVLRLGPVVGAGYDLGGLPSWIIPESERRLRVDHPEFLGRCSAYFSALGSQLKRLQATASGAGVKPIVAVQVEHQWTCDHRELEANYLGQLNRYVREAGFAVPIFARNQGFAAAEGDTEVWSGGAHLLATTRQLGLLNADRPRVVLGVPPSAEATWGDAGGGGGAHALLRSCAEVLAGAGQFNVDPLFGGTCFGFEGGRLARSSDAFVRTAWLPDAPIGESGERREAYWSVRRLATFATRFDRVFAGVEANRAHVAMAPGADGAGSKKRGRAAGVVDLSGSAGRVVFVFDEAAAGARVEHELLLPNGSSLNVGMGDQPVSWVLMNTNIGGRAMLDYCTLSALGVSGPIFVCFGAAGVEGMISLNGSHFEVAVPDGDEPRIAVYEGVTVVVCNTSLADRTFFRRDSVVIGASGLDAAGEPIGLKTGGSEVIVVRDNATIERVSAAGPPRASGSLKMTDWAMSGTDTWVDGTNERYALIDGPGSMESLGVPSGYAWLRVRFKQSATKRMKLGMVQLADRGTVFFDGEAGGVFGAGPGAEVGMVQRSVRAGDRAVVVLVDNLGRDDSGSDQHRPKGLTGHIQQLAPVKGAPAVEELEPIEPLELRAPLVDVHDGDLTDARRLVWTLTHRKKTSLLLHVTETPCLIVVLVNGEPVEVFERRRPAAVVLDADMLNRGKNTIEIAMLGDADEHLRMLKESASLHECVASVSEKGDWALGKWEPPKKRGFEAIAEGEFTAGRLGKLKGTPRWWRCSFEVRKSGVSAAFDATGLSKGQLFINGKNLCRYFVETERAQTEYRVPADWLVEGANELMIFDEGGFAPVKCKMKYVG